MKRLESRIDTLRIHWVRIQTSPGRGHYAGTLKRSDDMWIWTCPDAHQSIDTAKACVRRELKRWVA